MKKTYAKPMAEKFEFDYTEVVAATRAKIEFDVTNWVCDTRFNDGAGTCYTTNNEYGSHAYYECTDKK